MQALHAIVHRNGRVWVCVRVRVRLQPCVTILTLLHLARSHLSAVAVATTAPNEHVLGIFWQTHWVHPHPTQRISYVHVQVQYFEAMCYVLSIGVASANGVQTMLCVKLIRFQADEYEVIYHIMQSLNVYALDQRAHSLDDNDATTEHCSHHNSQHGHAHAHTHVEAVLRVFVAVECMRTVHTSVGTHNLGHARVGVASHVSCALCAGAVPQPSAMDADACI